MTQPLSSNKVESEKIQLKNFCWDLTCGTISTLALNALSVTSIDGAIVGGFLYATACVINKLANGYFDGVLLHVYSMIGAYAITKSILNISLINTLPIYITSSLLDLSIIIIIYCYKNGIKNTYERLTHSHS